MDKNFLRVNYNELEEYQYAFVGGTCYDFNSI